MEDNEYWTLVTIMLFIIITLDLLTSIYASYTVGSINEKNQLMRKILESSTIEIIIVHIIAIILVSLFFYALKKAYENTNNKIIKNIFGKLIISYIFSITSIGTFIVLNNIFVIFHKKDLISTLLYILNN